MPTIKFRTYGSNTAFGSFGPGDLLRTSDAMAKHLVELGIAQYAEQPKVLSARAAQDEADAPDKAPRRKAKG